jgi:hypothetical protein
LISFAVSALSGEGVLALGVEMSFRSRGHCMVRLRYSRRGADNGSLPGHTLRRGPEGHGKAARDGRHLAGSVIHGANMPAHGFSARSASAVSGKSSRICCSCSMISSAMASLIARLGPARSFLKSVFSPGAGCHAHRRAGICIYDACVDKCVAVLGQAVPAEPPSLPEWALMWDDGWLLDDQRALHKCRCSTCVVSVRSTGGRGERLVRGQAPEAT